MKIGTPLWSRAKADALKHLKCDTRWFLPHIKEGNSVGILVSFTSKYRKTPAGEQTGRSHSCEVHT